MQRNYEYHGFEVEVSVETSHCATDNRRAASRVGYVCVVRIRRAGSPVSAFAPLRLAQVCGRPFSSEADALMSGFSAGCRLIDDLE